MHKQSYLAPQGGPSALGFHPSQGRGKSIIMQPGGKPFGRSIAVAVVSPSPKLVATSSHSSLLLTILKP